MAGQWFLFKEQVPADTELTIITDNFSPSQAAKCAWLLVILSVPDIRKEKVTMIYDIQRKYGPLVAKEVLYRRDECYTVVIFSHRTLETAFTAFQIRHPSSSPTSKSNMMIPRNTRSMRTNRNSLPDKCKRNYPFLSKIRRWWRRVSST